MIPLEEIRRARERIADAVMRTPLVRIDADAPCEIWLKLECLQPIGSFKLRGALSAVRAASPAELAGGVVTASAGNMAQGLAWAAREGPQIFGDRGGGHRPPSLREASPRIAPLGFALLDRSLRHQAGV